MIVDAFDFACAFTLAELLTITLVIGKPPIRPEAMLPIPCANNSRLGEVALFSGSSLSTASIHNSVSIDATAAIVKAIIYTCGFFNCEKSGNVKKLTNSLKLEATGTFTKCPFVTAKLLPALKNIWFNTTAVTTATNPPGNNRNFFLKKGLSQRIRIANDTTHKTVAPRSIFAIELIKP